MIRFAIKVGLAGGAVICLRDQGVWRSSSETEKTLESLKATLKPALEQVKSVLPFELPEAPKNPIPTDFSVASCWNNMVLMSFQFVADFPEKCQNLTASTYKSTLDNESVKNFINSLSSSPQNNEVVVKNDKK